MLSSTPVRIEQGDIEIRITAVNTQGEEASKTTYILNLEAVPDVLTGETVSDTSEFTAQSYKLKRAQSFDGVISAIKIKGEKFNDVEFKFPEGNEGEK